MEDLGGQYEAYGKRLSHASWIEYKKWWSGYRIVVTFSGLTAILFVQATRHGVHSMLNIWEVLESGAIGLSLSFVGTYLYARRKGAETLDRAHIEVRNAHQTEAALLRIKIEEAKRELERASTKPKRTPAEQHHYQKAKAALEKHGSGSDHEKILRHLQTHERITFESGGNAPHLPSGMTKEHAEYVLEELKKDDLVTSSVEYGRPGADCKATWVIAPAMKKPLEDLLYPASNSESSQT